MTKKRKWVLIAIVAVVILFCVGAQLTFLSALRLPYSGELLVDAEVFNIANQFQHHTGMQLTASGNKLYFHVSKLTEPGKLYTDWVCTIENGRINRIISIKEPVVLCMDTVAWFQHSAGNKDEVQVFVQLYDIPANAEQKTPICDTIEMNSDNWFYLSYLCDTLEMNPDDLFFLMCPSMRFISPDSFLLSKESPLFAEDSEYGVCQLYENGSYRDVEAKSVGYEIQGKTYCLEYSQVKDEVEIVCYDCVGNREALNILSEWSGTIDLIPCDYGLLVHNYEERYVGSDGVLYLVDKETGEIRELFNIPGMSSESSVNVWGKYVFISLKRWEGWSDTGKGMKRFENDQLEGTWRIDLTDGSKVKISDTIYTGLYIFDDSGIFACNKPMWNTYLYKLDFDGNVLFQILD